MLAALVTIRIHNAIGLRFVVQNVKICQEHIGMLWVMLLPPAGWYVMSDVDTTTGSYAMGDGDTSSRLVCYG